MQINIYKKSIRRGNFRTWGVWSPRKSYLFLNFFEKAPGKFDLVFMVFFPPGKSYFDFP